MIDHLGINVADITASARFYDAVLGTLGQRRLMDFGVAIGYGTAAPQFWISTFDGVGVNREVHLAFGASDVEHVLAFYDAALAHGASSLHEPRLWPEYHPGYFGAFVRDLDGNNIEAVGHRAELGSPVEPD